MHNNIRRDEIGMDKKWIICIIIAVVLGLVAGIGFAIYSSNSNKTEGLDILSEKELAEENTYYNNSVVDDEEDKKAINILETSATEESISPNAVITKRIYYTACDHLKKETEEVPEDLVNKKEEDIEKEFADWKIEKFSPTEIVLYKEMSGNCGEHYFVQEHNGVIGIYTIDEYGVKTLKEDTEIVTQYLPEEDLQNLKAGVEIVGYTKLTEFLEDYE